nr:hypothetical protein [uncultured Merdimonas sp.]
MMLIAGVVLGAVFLLGGAFRLQESKKKGEGTRLYALITYAGLAAMVVSTMELIKPFLTFIPDDYRTLFVFAIDIAVLILGGDTILKPEFEDGGGKKRDNHLSEYRDRQNSYRPKNKKRRK